MMVGDPLLVWRDGVRPVPASRRFDDLYYSASDGLTESRRVFLGGNDLPERFVGRRFFAVGETGFGTGLNFLATWRAWAATAPADGRLMFLSVEGFPLTRKDLARALAGWPELKSQAGALTAVYPERPPAGLHRLHLENGRVTLMLLIGEAVGLGRLEGRVDAWYLDGFAPARNPEIWRPEVLAAVASLSGPGTTLASFTAAGAVRRGLAAVGFDVDRRPGFQGKRHRIVGRYTAPRPTDGGKSWYRRTASPNAARTAAVIGGGIAGAGIAYALTRRGIPVTLFEGEHAVASGASGNPVGIIAPNPTAGPTTAGAFSCAAFAEARAVIDRHGSAGIGQDWSGVLDFSDPDPAARAPRLLDQEGQGAIPVEFLGPDAASDDAGVRLDRPAIRFDTAGRINPAALCAALTAGVERRCGVFVDRLEQTDAGWRLVGIRDVPLFRADLVVIASGPGLAAFAQTAWLPVTPRRGQVSLVATDAPARVPRRVLLRGCYVLPADAGRLCVGATYTDPDPPGVTAQAVRDVDHAENLGAAAAAFPGLDLTAATTVLGGRAALRATTPDRQPLVGAVPDRVWFLSAFAGSRAGQAPIGDPCRLPGLYVLGGLGSRGLTTALLAAEIIAAEALGEPSPVLRAQRERLHPARVLVQGLKRREIR